MALSGVALALTEAAENLAQMAKDLANIHPTEWMTAKQVARHLGCELAKAFESTRRASSLWPHVNCSLVPVPTSESSVEEQALFSEYEG